MFQHACEGEAVIKLTNSKIPYFNAPMYLENITQVRTAAVRLVSPGFPSRVRHHLASASGFDSGFTSTTGIRSMQSLSIRLFTWLIGPPAMACMHVSST